MPEKSQRGSLGAVPDCRVPILPKLIAEPGRKLGQLTTPCFEGIIFLPYELALNTRQIVLGGIGIFDLNHIFPNIVLLNEILIILGRALDLWPASATFDTTIKASKILRSKGIWWLFWGHENNELVFL